MLIKKIFYQELVSNAVKILTVLVFILPITELFKLLENGGSSNIPAPTLIAFMLYGTIASFPMILTIACFLTVVITINRYCKDHEFSVWLSSGISPFFWLKAVSKFAIPFTIICAVCTMYITPWATSKRIQYTDYLSKQQTNMLISPGVFRENGNGRDVFYLDHYSLLSGYAKDIFVQYVGDDGITYNITATDGKLEHSHNVASLILKNAHRDQISDNQTNKYNRVNLSFNQLKATIKQDYNPNEFKNTSIDTSSITNLVNSIKSKDPRNARAELSWRISIAIMLFVMTILAVPISIQTGRIQGNLVFIVPPIIYAIYNNLILTLNGYLNQGKISSICIVQLLHIALMLFGLFLTYYKTYPKGYWFSKSRKIK
ncbi:MAG: LptF/LptG family permease [Burkholderiales bacterium]|nr:LptF/LptG family permease [Burkholderiales bacterium]